MKYYLVMVLLLAAGVCRSQQQDVKGNAAYLFAYYPKENAQTLFENGYKKHLSWHAGKDDPLVWYAWYVQTGERLGMFIDGSFGISHRAFANRVEPASDGTDFAQTTAPFVTDAFRKIYQLKPALSTASLLEDHKPSATIEVYTIVVEQGMESNFEQVIGTLRNKLNPSTGKLSFTLYQLLSGGEQSGYMLMIPRDGYAGFSHSTFTSIGQLIQQTFSPKEAATLNKQLSACIKEVRSETWGYRPDLSLIPGG